MIITRIVIPYFKKNARGDIIFMGSESALEGKKMGKSLGNFITLNEFFTGNHKKLKQCLSRLQIL